MAAKAKRIRDLVKLNAPIDPEFCRAERSPTTRSRGSSRSTVSSLTRACCRLSFRPKHNGSG
jgi:hypothetical protein